MVGKEWFPHAKHKGSRPPTDIILRRRVRLRFARGERRERPNVGLGMTVSIVTTGT